MMKEKDAERIIQNHSYFSTIPGFWPVPVLDIAAVSSIQLDMIKQLCKLYEKEYNEQKGKSIVTALLTTIAGRIPGYTVRSIVKSVPVVGWFLGGLSLAVSARISTYATGRVFKSHFEEGGTLNDLNPDNFRKFYQEEMEKARELWKWTPKINDEKEGEEKADDTEKEEKH